MQDGETMHDSPMNVKGFHWQAQSHLLVAMQTLLRVRYKVGPGSCAGLMIATVQNEISSAMRDIDRMQSEKTEAHEHV